MRTLFEAVTAHETMLDESDELLRRGLLPEARIKAQEAYSFRPGSRTAYGLALAHERLGNLREAARLYAEALDYQPGYVEARVNLGAVARELGDLDEALHQHVTAAALAPEHPVPRFNVGVTLERAGWPLVARAVLAACVTDHPDFALARRALRRVSKAAPGSPSVASQAGRECPEAVAHAEAGRDHDAVAVFESFLAANTGSADTWTDYGSALLRLGRNSDALAAQEMAVKLEAACAPALHNLGATLQSLGDHAPAITAYRRALAVYPRLTMSWFNLGKAYVALGQHRLAWDAYNIASLIDASFADAIAELAEVSRILGRRESAIAAMQRLERLWPDHFLVQNNMGTFLLDQGRHNEALERFTRAAATNPHSGLVHSNIGAVYELTGQFGHAFKAYSRAVDLSPRDTGLLLRQVHVAQHVCHWDGIGELFSRACTAIRQGDLGGVQPFSLLAIPGITPADQLMVARAYAERSFAHIQPIEPVPRAGERDGRVRIGYLSSDFCNHATAWLVAEMIELHDRSRFEVFAYAYGVANEDETRKRLRRSFDHFADVSAMPDEAAARKIRDDGIDILIDLKGYTQGTRTGVLASRPAAVQISHVGFPGTSGADFVDFFVADDVLIPPELESFYSERILRLPRCYQPNDRQRPLPPAPDRAQAGLPQDAFVFCSFNNVYKITPDVFDIWCRLLHDVAGSVLWILSNNAETNQNLRIEAERRGVAGERLLFAPRASLFDHLARFRCADVFLDSFPCSAHTTASDALWCGVPVVTRIGDTFASRVAASVLHAVDLPQLVTRDAESYYALARRLATHREELAALKEHLERVRFTCALFDTTTYTRNLESLYLQALASMRV